MIMSFPSKRASLALLSIIIPVSLLAAFRVTGVLPGPPNRETVAVEAVSWNMSRLYDYKRLDELVNNSYITSVVSINLTVHVVNYYENDPVRFGLDNVDSIVLVNMSVREGFVESLFVNFAELDNHAALDIHQDMDHIDLVNLEVAKIVDWNEAFGRNASFKATSINQPANAYLRFPLGWMFRDHNDTNHQLTITLEATLFNGATYQKIRIPIQMGVFIG
jgi:hypothetical protein